MTIDEQLRAVVETGWHDELAASYAPDARLDAVLLGRTVRRRGRDAIAAELGGWWDGPGRLDSWEVVRSSGGVRVDFERTVTAGDSTRCDRQVHYLHVGPAGVAWHVVFTARPSGAPRQAPGEPIPSFLRDARERGGSPVGGEGHSGSWLERVVLADGEPAIVKHISPQWDWIMRATRDPGREALLWRDGVLDDLPGGVRCPVIAVEPEGEGWAIAMHDVSTAMLPVGEPVTRDQARRLLTAVDALHRRFEGAQVPHAASLDERLAIFTPSVAVVERYGVDVVPKMIGMGWEVLAEQVDHDVASVALRLAEDPAPLVSELRAGGTTLIHGDFRHGNLGIDGDRIVALDWALACQAPSDVEFLWYLDFGPFEVRASREQLIDDWRDIRGVDFDEYRFDLALMYEFVFHGWFYALGSVVSADPDLRRSYAEGLAWHLDRSRQALEFWSPVWA